MAKRPTVAPANARAGQGQPRPSREPRVQGIRVRATQVCYYDDKRRRVGDVFTIANETQFSAKYMERVDRSTPERITTAKQALKKEHDQILGATLKTRDESNPLGAD